jgi:osmoprotectant transport system ATP-binding protein
MHHRSRKDRLRPMISLKDIDVSYGERQVLDRVSLTIAPRETMVLLGGSGAGKSTILKTILRLIPIQRGSITLDDTDISQMDRVALRRAVGMVFQSIALFPHLNVSQNVALPLRLLAMGKKEIRDRVTESLELVGLNVNEYGLRYPHMLSGGQQQRVGVARAIARKPVYLLMDEPFGALDAITRRHLQEELKVLRSKLGITILFVTHDVMEAATLGDCIAVMDQGKILQTGSIRELMEHPAHERVRELVSTPLMELRTFVKDSVR